MRGPIERGEPTERIQQQIWREPDLVDDVLKFQLSALGEEETYEIPDDSQFVLFANLVVRVKQLAFNYPAALDEHCGLLQFFDDHLLL